MKNQTRPKPTASKLSLLRQLCNLIPPHLVPQLARATGNAAHVRAGEIVIFDKAYLDFAHLADLAMREVFWVTRAKENLQCHVVQKLQTGPHGNLLRDDLVILTGAVQADYPVRLRRVTARVEVDGELRELVFLTNNVTWSAQTIADLYRCRWSIEFFLLLRFCACLSQWGHSFTRLFALIRSALWQKLDLNSLLESYGTAGGGGRFLGTPQQAYLPGYG